MSLKAFHIFFIAIATLMCFGIAVWQVVAYSATGSMAQLGQALGSAIAGIGLIFYGVSFVRKTKALHLSDI